MPTTATHACPYCNAFVPILSDISANQRLVCPRCGEVFAYRPRVDVNGPFPTTSLGTFPSNGQLDSSSVDTDTLNAKMRLLFRILIFMAVAVLVVGIAYSYSLYAEGSKTSLQTFIQVAFSLGSLFVAFGAVAFLWLWFFRVRRSNSVTLLFILGNMLLLAALTLAGALASREYRRHNDAGLPARPKRSPIPEEPAPSLPPGPVAPVRLAALSYLPSGINLLLGARVSELLDDQVGRKLLTEPVGLGTSEVRLAGLIQKTGLKLEELDHFLLGMRADEPLSVVFVVRTRLPYDSKKILQSLEARTISEKSGNRTFYQVKVPLGNVAALLWCADKQTFLIALARKTLEKASLPEESNSNFLTPTMRDVLHDRVGPVGPLWAVGCSNDWKGTVAELALASVPAKWRQMLFNINAFAIRAEPSSDAIILYTSICCSDEKTAKEFENRVSVDLAHEKSDLKVAREDNWLTLQMRTNFDLFHRLP